MCLGCGSGSSFLPFFLKDVFGMVAKLKLLTNKEVKPKRAPLLPRGPCRKPLLGFSDGLQGLFLFVTQGAVLSNLKTKWVQVP